MAVFKIFLIGSPEAIEVDLRTDNLTELAVIASRTRFLAGFSSSESGGGIERGVMNPTVRIHLIVQE